MTVALVSRRRRRGAWRCSPCRAPRHPFLHGRRSPCTISTSSTASWTPSSATSTAGSGCSGRTWDFLTTTLIGIDITLAGLFWALGGEDNVIGRFIKKILYIGAFAFILNSFSTLSDIIFRSFAQAGLTAGGGTFSAERPAQARPARRDRLLRRASVARADVRPDGVHQLLREFRDDRGASSPSACSATSSPPASR
jgi:hypothetical protein